jgi:ABC-type lipoprotein export system ATPase subunit/bifunctional DNA-binding transcriptional regulator/antitoxin component of YhaV-PrlF toxin-antitoxin module
MASEPFIICDNLVKIYKIANLEVFALQGLDLIVAPGELMGIVGASGSGKSTLMNILGGLDRPSAGRVWVDGNDLLKMSDSGLNRYRRSKVGFVWQQAARNLIPYLSAVENVELPMTLAGNARGAKKRAKDLLEVVGLGERGHHGLAQLSGGEQQRVAIAVSLANSPSLLLADEPTGEVDSQTALSIYQTFQSLNRELGLTILIVSHDTGIARHVQRVVAIRDGKLASETVRQVTPTNGADAAVEGAHVDEVFEELVVLDSAGRLQIPKDYLERFSIQGRAKLEITEDGILIVPAGPQGEERIQETRAGELIPVEKRRHVRDMFRLGRGKKAS